MSTIDMMVRLTEEQFLIGSVVAQKLGLVIDEVYGNRLGYVDVAARRAGPRGNHEPRWTEKERLEFIRRIND